MHRPLSNRLLRNSLLKRKERVTVPSAFLYKMKKEQNKQIRSNTEEQEPSPLVLLWLEIKRLSRSKKAWTVAILFFLLILFTGVVPVGKIPFLRNIAWAMGYTPEETQDISFLKALLSWNEHAKIQRAELDNPNEIGIFGKDGGLSSAYGRMSAEKDASLINLRVVNASLSKQGKAGDFISGSYHTLGEGDSNPAVAHISGETANTQANAVQPDEVYFGSDVSAVARNPKDGFNTTNSLKKIANPHISGTGESDWLGKLVDKATRSDAGLSNIAKSLKTGGTLSQLNPITDIGNHKAQRDMYYAWLTGMSARRTPNVVLKKTLASAGFDGADMPKKVFNSSGFSGIGINPDDVVSDLDNIKLRLQNEKECERALSSSGEVLTNQLQAAKEGINVLAGSFPKTCDEVDGDFSNRLSVLRNQCEQVKLAYSDLGTFCGVAVKVGREGTCTTNNLQGRYDQYASYCAAEKEKCAALETPEEQKACMGEIKAAADYEEGDCHDKGCSEEGVSKLVEGTFNVNVNGNPVDPNAGDFFPEADWGSTQFY